jgi:hypothetical protein
VATVPTFTTYVAGSVLTAASLNTNVRDPGIFFLSTPVCELRQTSAQSLTNGVPAAILFDTEDIDTDGMHSTASNTSRVTAVTAGRYQFSGGGTFANNATGVRSVNWSLNGTANNGSPVQAINVGASSVPELAARTKTILMAVGQFVELVAAQSSGGALNTFVTAPDQPNLSCRWVGTT